MAKKTSAKSKKKTTGPVKAKKKSTTTKKTTLKSKKKPTKKVATKAKTKKKVSAIPKGYNAITPYLIVNDAAKAIDFYKTVFSAKELMRMDRPDGKIGHSEHKIGDSKIMLADECPEMGAHGPHVNGGCPISIHLYVKNVDHVVASAVSKGAKIKRPIQDMFYGDRSGSVEDPFGHIWYVSTHIEDVSKAVMKKRAAQMFGKRPA